MDQKPDNDKMNEPGKEPGRPRNMLAWLLIIGTAVILFFVLSQEMNPRSEEAYSLNRLYGDILDGKVNKVTIREDGTAIIEMREEDLKREGKGPFEMAFPRQYLDSQGINAIQTGRVPGYEALPDVEKQHVLKNAPEVITEPPRGMFLTILLSWLPWILILVVIYWIFMRQMRGAGMGGGLLSFGKSKAFKSDPDKVKVTFKDVAGIDEAKEEVEEIIAFLKNPGKFTQIGGRIPRGILLVGAPGTGKTLLAKAIAGEAGVPFFSISGSDFVEMFVGVGASRVRDLFKQAKSQSPCIVFLDEIDAVGRKRGTGLGGGHDEREQTLNAILVEMDGFERDEGIILIAATNRPDVLDPALLRPGRFDREIVIDLPDVKGREEILKVHSRKVKMADDMDLSVIARGTPMFSGAELEALINEAAIVATMRGKKAVDMSDMEEARDKVKWGKQKKSRIMSEEDKKRTAFHEAGHALMTTLIPEVEPLHKVTIIPRGMSLGATMILPEKDRYTYSRKQALADIAVLFGGYTVEELLFDDLTSGAKNDIENATKLARLMVTEWGMSEKLGPINYSETFEHQFLGRDFAGAKQYSEATAQLIDQEVRRIIGEARERAKNIINENRETLERVADALLKYESLSGRDVEDLVNGKEIKPENNSGFPTSRGTAKKSAFEEINKNDKNPEDVADEKKDDPERDRNTEENEKKDDRTEPGGED